MKKEIDPKVVAAIIAVVVVVIGVFLFRQATVNPPTPRPDAKYFGGGAASTAKPGK